MARRVSSPVAASVGVLALRAVGLAAVAAGARLLLGRATARGAEQVTDRTAEAGARLLAVAGPLLARALDLALLPATLVGHGDHHAFALLRFPARFT